MRNFKFFFGYDGWSDIATHVVPIANARTVALRARLANEISEELETLHAIDAEDELTRILSAQIAEEMDREVIRRLTRDWDGLNIA
jgi:hypothetical protein